MYVYGTPFLPYVNVTNQIDQIVFHYWKRRRRRSMQTRVVAFFSKEIKFISKNQMVLYDVRNWGAFGRYVLRKKGGIWSQGL